MKKALIVMLILLLKPLYAAAVDMFNSPAPWNKLPPGRRLQAAW